MVAYNKWRLLEQGQQLALVRFEGIKQRALQGDVPSIDTVEAIIAVQNLQVMASQALVEYKNSSLVVSNFLWTENNTPLEITNEAVPSLTGNENVITESSSLERLIQQAQTNHPELVKIRVKLSQLNIERRFLVDKFKPKINLEYNMIQKGFPIAEEAFNSAYLSNNYKFGVGFSFPVFLRNERGKLQLNALKQTEMNLDLQQSGREISNQIQASYNEIVALQQQVTLQEEMVNNAEILRNGELELFNNGESSMFLINSREMYLITNRIKLFELRAKHAKAKIILQWAAGNIGNSIP
jgi:outer membrane protein TolC